MLTDEFFVVIFFDPGNEKDPFSLANRGSSKKIPLNNLIRLPNLREGPIDETPGPGSFGEFSLRDCLFMRLIVLQNTPKNK